MRIVDAFCGVGPWAFRDRILPYRAEEILGLLDHFGIEQALAYPTMATDWGWPWSSNRQVEEAVRVSRRFVPAFTLALHPYDDDPGLDDYFGAMRRAGAKAVWLFPKRNRELPGLWKWYAGELFDRCVEARLPVFLHADDLNPDELEGLCAGYPDLRVVLAGAGYGGDRWIYPLLKRHRSLRLCLGHYYIPAGNPMRFLRHFDAGRLLFGSGLPHFSPGGLIGHVMYADIPAPQKEAILSGNCLGLMEDVRL